MLRLSHPTKAGSENIDVWYLHAMAYLIGTDEAGYAPNLGPLVITATVWRIDGELGERELYDLLGHCVCRAPDGPDDERVVIADSKSLYKSNEAMQGLERGVATALRACGRAPNAWRDIWSAVAGMDAQQLTSIPWHDGYDEQLPLSCERDKIDQTATQFCNGLAKAGIELVSIRSCAVFPAEFNDLVDSCGNKASLLSLRTLELVRQELAERGAEPTMVFCDKHGGRNNYVSVLQTLFPDYLVEVRRESRAESIYRWGPKKKRVEFRFMVNGETFLPTALASMVSKYLRELAMRAFNAFWLFHVPGIQRTAGYPADSRRFKKQIAVKQQELGIGDHHLWRCR